MLTFRLFPEQELGTKGRYLSPPKVFSLKSNIRQYQWWKRKSCKWKGYFTFLHQTWNVSRLKPQNILVVIQFLDFISLWKMKQMREGCGLFTLAEWVSSVCKDSALPWCDPHSLADTIAMLSVIPADSKQRTMALMVFEDRDQNHCEPQRVALPHPVPSVGPILYSWHNDVIDCWALSQENVAFLFYSSLLIVG